MAKKTREQVTKEILDVDFENMSLMTMAMKKVNLKKEK
jgi:hypothetical protein